MCIRDRVRGKRFDNNIRTFFAYGPDALRVVICTAVGEIVTVDGGQNNVVQVHQFDRSRRVFWLFKVQPAFGIARIHGTKLTGSRAGCAHKHDGRRAMVPALTNIWAVGLFTDSGQAVFANGIPNPLVALPGPGTDSEPGGLSLNGMGRILGRLDAIFNGRKALGRRKFFAIFNLFHDCYRFETGGYGGSHKGPRQPIALDALRVRQRDHSLKQEHDQPPGSSAAGGR